MNEDLMALIKEHTTTAEMEALMLHANGHSHTEAAGFLGISRRAYRDRINRAMRRVRKHTHAADPPFIGGQIAGPPPPAQSDE